MFDPTVENLRKIYKKYGDKLLSIKTHDEAVEFLNSLPKGEEAAIIATMDFVHETLEKNNEADIKKLLALIANGAKPWQAAVLFIRGLGDERMENVDRKLDALKKALDDEQSNS